MIFIMILTKRQRLGKKCSQVSFLFSYFMVVFFPRFIGTNLTPGQKVTAVILHIDILSSSVHVSVLPRLLVKKKSVSVAFTNSISEQIIIHDCSKYKALFCRDYN